MSLHTRFIQEFIGSPLAMPARELLIYGPRILKSLNGEEIVSDPLPKLSLKGFSKQAGLFDFNDMPEDEKKMETVGIIPIHGALSKFGTWWSYGADDYVYMLNLAYEDEEVKAVVIDFHTPGGSTDAIFTIQEAIQRRNKPVIAFVNNKMFSAGVFLAMYTDKIFAINKMAEVGSIGVMATIMDDSKMYEEFGIVIKEFVPPESKWKNKAYKDALTGDGKILIEDQLTPFAIEFQNIVKTNRPNLNLEIEGIIEGRTFYAGDAVEYGLIDGIMSSYDTYQYALDYAETYNTTRNKLSNILK